MNRSRTAMLIVIAAIALLGFVPPASAAAPQYAGVYTSDKIKLVLKPDGDGLGGVMTIGPNGYPVKAKPDGDTLRGTFTAQGADFAFSATLAGDDLTLVSDGNKHLLKRVTPKPPNPLGNLQPQPTPQPPNPLNPQPQPPAPTPTPTPTPTQPQPQPQPTPPGTVTTVNLETGEGLPTPVEAVEKVKDLGPVQEDPNRKWLVMIYLDGDCDLEQHALDDMNEAEAGMTDGVEIIVLVDRAEGYFDGDGDWTDTRVYRLKKDGDLRKIAGQQIASLGEANMGDPRLLANFMTAAMKTFPAQKTMLVMWNHGGGWVCSANDHDAPGAPDGHDELSLPDLRAAVAGGVKGAGRKLDVIAFDMCLMAQLEVAAAVHESAHYMLASEALVPGKGYPYHTMMPALTEHADDIPAMLRKMAVEFDLYYEQIHTSDTTLSAFDLKLTPQVVAAFDAVIGKCLPTLARQWPAASRTLFYSENYIGRVEITKTGGTASIDLQDMLARLQTMLKPFPAESELADLQKLMGRYVLASETDYVRRKSRGVSLYAPVVERLMLPKYLQETQLGAATHWGRFLTGLHAMQKQHTQPAVFSDVRITDSEGKPIAAIQPLGGHELRFSLTGDNIIWTQMWSGIRTGDGKLRILDKGFITDGEWVKRLEEATDHIELLMPVYKDGKNELADEVLGLTFFITDGANKGTATIDGSDLDNADTWTLRALYEHPSAGKDPVPLIIGFDMSTWRAKSVVAFFPQPDNTMQVRRIEPEPDAKITLLHQVINPQTGDKSNEVGGVVNWNKGLSLILAVNKPGDYAAILVAETMSDVRSYHTVNARIEANPEIEQVAAGWADFQPDHMLGKWELNLMNEQGALVPTGAVYTIAATDKPDIYAAELRTKDAPDDPTTVVWILDRQGVPNLRMIELDANNRPAGRYLGLAFYGVKDGQPRLLCKMANVGGMFWVFTKADGAKITANRERFEPVPTPDPQPLR